MPHRFNLGAVGFDDTLVFLELFVGLEQKVAQMLNILLHVLGVGGGGAVAGRASHLGVL